MIQKRILLVAVVIFFVGVLSAQEDTAKVHWFREYYKKYVRESLRNRHSNYIPPKGVIPDSATAIKVADVILSEVYGRPVIDRQKPFTAILVDGYWVIYGHLPDNFLFGGVAETIIRKTNGEIIRVSHGK